jgi:hypothetical protein
VSAIFTVNGFLKKYYQVQHVDRAHSICAQLERIKYYQKSLVKDQVGPMLPRINFHRTIHPGHLNMRDIDCIHRYGQLGICYSHDIDFVINTLAGKDHYEAFVVSPGAIRCFNAIICSYDGEMRLQFAFLPVVLYAEAALRPAFPPDPDCAKILPLPQSPIKNLDHEIY